MTTQQGRLALVTLALVSAACATLADAESGGDNLPNADAGPFRALRAEETIATFDLRNQELCEQRRMLARSFMFFLVQALEDDLNPADVEQWLLDMTNPRRPWRSVLRQIVRDPQNARLIKRVRATLPALRPAFDALST